MKIKMQRYTALNDPRNAHTELKWKMGKSFTKLSGDFHAVSPKLIGCRPDLSPGAKTGKKTSF